MEELFNTRLPDGTKPDVQLCIFPHLKEFLTIDLRPQEPEILLLSTDDVFVDEFFKSVEADFSDAVREEADYPFAHLMNLPLRLEEAIRDTAMTFILDRLGIRPDDDEEIPTVVVFIVSGGALTAQSERVLEGLKELLKANLGDNEATVIQWEEVLSRLIAEENQILQQLSRQELTEALRGDSPDYFTLWDNRN